MFLAEITSLKTMTVSRREEYSYSTSHLRTFANTATSCLPKFGYFLSPIYLVEGMMPYFCMISVVLPEESINALSNSVLRWINHIPPFGETRPRI